MGIRPPVVLTGLARTEGAWPRRCQRPTALEEPGSPKSALGRCRFSIDNSLTP